jgi:hypothetical protein
MRPVTSSPAVLLGPGDPTGRRPRGASSLGGTTLAPSFPQVHEREPAPGARGVRKLDSRLIAGGSIASPSSNSGGRAWFGRSSMWCPVACFSWSCCCADRSARRSSRSLCSDMSSRSCAGSRGERGFDLSIGRFSRRSRAGYRVALGELVGASGDAVALAPPAGQPALD